ncbi:MAG: HAD hydrolase-like protein [Desulfuromonadales bacterium]
MIIYFDFDGTLVDVQNKYYAVYSSYVSRFAGTFLDRCEFWKLKRTRSGDAQILYQSGLGHQPVSLFRDYIRDQIETSRYLQEDQLFPEVEHVLGQLCMQHRCRIISARRNKRIFLEQIEQLGVRKYFDQVLVAPTQGSGGQELKAKASAMKSSLDSHTEMIIVGDTEEDIISGQQLNMKTVAVTSGLRDRPYLETLSPDHILASVTELVICLESKVP